MSSNRKYFSKAQETIEILFVFFLNWKDSSETMAENNGKRKARDMNGSIGSDDYEPEIKARRTNDNRRRSSFVRGIQYC